MVEMIVRDVVLDDSDDEIFENVPRIRKFNDLRDPFAGLSDAEIIERYRFPPNVILELVDRLSPEIEQRSSRSRAVPALHQVCIGLRYLASNSFQQVVGDTFGVAKSSACRSLWRFAKSLAGHLNEHIKFPAGDERLAERRRFFDVAQFPNVIGLIDGTHVRILAPHQNEAVFVNRKGFHSINVQGICRSDGSFSNIVAKWPGSTHDSRIFRESAISQQLQTGVGNEVGYLLGDSGYACSTCLLTPVANAITEPQRNFNRAHRKTRVLVEQVFGRWKRRFSCLQSELRVEPEKCCLLIVCCAILHNVAIRNNLPEYENDEVEENVQDNVAAEDPVDLVGARYREYVIEQYFV